MTGATSQFTLGVRCNFHQWANICYIYLWLVFSTVTFRLGPRQPASSSAHLPKRETLGALDFLGHQDYRRWIGSDSKVPGRFQVFGANGVVWEVLLYFFLIWGILQIKKLGGKLYGLSVDSTGFYLCMYVIRSVLIHLISNMYILRMERRPRLQDFFVHIPTVHHMTKSFWSSWNKKLSLNFIFWIIKLRNTHKYITILVYISQKITHTYMFIYDAKNTTLAPNINDTFLFTKEAFTVIKKMRPPRKNPTPNSNSPEIRVSSCWMKHLRWVRWINTGGRDWHLMKMTMKQGHCYLQGIVPSQRNIPTKCPEVERMVNQAKHVAIF